MYFKNIIPFKVSLNDELPSDLTSFLKPMLFKDCTPRQEHSAGWVSPFGDDGPVLAHSTTNAIHICFKTEEKDLPASVVNEEVKKRINAWVKKNVGVKPSREFKSSLKDQVRTELLPKAFSKYNRINAYIDRQQEVLFVDTTTRKKAEKLVLTLSQCLQKKIDINPVLIYTENPVQEELTRWVKDDTSPDNFEIGDKCQISKEDNGIIRYANYCLSDKNLVDYLKSGLTVIELEMLWEEHLRFRVTEDFVIKSIVSVEKQKPKSSGSKTLYELIDEDLADSSEQLTACFQSLLSCFGGISETTE